MVSQWFTSSLPDVLGPVVYRFKHLCTLLFCPTPLLLLEQMAVLDVITGLPVLTQTLFI